MTASSVKRFDIRYLIPVIARVFDKNTFAVKKLYVAVPVFNRYRYISEIRLDGKREQTEFVGKSVKGAYFRYTVVIGKARSDRFGTFLSSESRERTIICSLPSSLRRLMYLSGPESGKSRLGSSALIRSPPKSSAST